MAPCRRARGARARPRSAQSATTEGAAPPPTSAPAPPRRRQDRRSQTALERRPTRGPHGAPRREGCAPQLRQRGAACSRARRAPDRRPSPSSSRVRRSGMPQCRRYRGFTAKSGPRGTMQRTRRRPSSKLVTGARRMVSSMPGSTGGLCGARAVTGRDNKIVWLHCAFCRSAPLLWL